MAVAVALTMTACEKAIELEDDVEPSEVVLPDGSVAKTKKFTFTLKGDFSGEWKMTRGTGENAGEVQGGTTRGYLQADGKDLTDVWVLDYMDGALVQQVHQDDNTAEDFGVPSMNLALGSHHIYFVASRGKTPVLDTEAHSLTWASVSDTFYKDYEVSVVATSNGNRAVTLDRCVSKLSMVVTDALPEACTQMVLQPTTWYLGLDYLTGLPTQTASYTSTITVPSSYAGRTGLSFSLFSIAPATEWQTSCTITARDSDGGSLGTATITDVSMLRNRETAYSGPLFSSGGEVTMALNTDWIETETGTW